MSNFRSPRHPEEITSPSLSPSSDEKMDTGSESFRSQDTPNSVKSSEFDSEYHTNTNEDVLRLQSPTDNVLRLAQPETNDNNLNQIKKPNLTDSIIEKMSNLNIDSPKIRLKTFAVSTPRTNSSLVQTTDHPLMCPESYPDVIPKKIPDGDLSVIPDEKCSDIFTSSLYSPQKNTSKNNLYMAENFVTAESQTLDLESSLPPDVARVERKKIVPKFMENISAIKSIGENDRDRYEVDAGSSHSENGIDVPDAHFYSGVAEWCESPSLLRSIPNFQMPLEQSSYMNEDHMASNSGLASPEDRSQYEACVDPFAGRVTLKHNRHTHTHSYTQRRRIQLPPEDDRCSLDSVSSSLDSEEEPQFGDIPEVGGQSDGEQEQRSKSTVTSSRSSPIPEYSLAEELNSERSWVTVNNGGHRDNCDVKVIEPFKRALSHGGYSSTGAAIIVFSACHLPDNRRPDYRYVMDNLFLYVIWTLERLVTDEYILVYLHGSAGSGRLPTFRWLLECYRLIDRRLRKSLKHLYLVHPTFWLKSFVILTKPFVSSKFFRKLSYVRSLSELQEKIPVEPNAIPEIVKQFDARN